MFTGLIEALGQITSITPLQQGIHVEISTEALRPRLSIGCSVAVNGVCSTATTLTKTGFTVDYLEETLKKTNFGHLKVGDIVNLELPLTPQSHIGGHFVTGHVDCIGTVTDLDKDGPWAVIRVAYPAAFRPYLIPKGSIAIDGISLTVVDLDDHTFSCHLIPHTQENTTLKIRRKDSSVNLEFDMLGKYLYRFHTLEKDHK
jgi:riboflavin synthase